MSAPSIVALATSIGALAPVYGGKTLTVLALGETPDAIDIRTCPVMFPDPEQTVTDFVTSRTGCGAGTGDVHGYAYTLNYFAAIFPVGEGRGLVDIMPDLGAWASLIVSTIADADDTLIASNNVLADVSVIGTITDPIGNVFHGLRIAVRVEEF